MLTVAGLGVRCIYYCIHIAVRLCCVCVIHRSYTNIDVIVDLLINTYICVSVTFVLFFSCERYLGVLRNNIFVINELDKTKYKYSFG